MKFHYITEHSGKLIARTIEAKDVIEAERIVYKHYHKAHIVVACELTNCSLPDSELGLSS